MPTRQIDQGILAGQDLTINTAVNLPWTFQRLRLTPSAGVTVTLASGFVAPGTIELTGTARAQVTTLVARIADVAVTHPQAAAYEPGLVL